MRPVPFNVRVSSNARPVPGLAIVVLDNGVRASAWSSTLLERFARSTRA